MKAINYQEPLANKNLDNDNIRRVCINPIQQEVMERILMQNSNKKDRDMPVRQMSDRQVKATKNPRSLNSSSYKKISKTPQEKANALNSNERNTKTEGKINALNIAAKVTKTVGVLGLLALFAFSIIAAYIPILPVAIGFGVGCATFVCFALSNLTIKSKISELKNQ